MANRLPPAWSAHVLSLLRVVSAFLLIAQGTMKVFSFPAASPMGHIGLLSRLGMAGLIETFGGGLLLRSSLLLRRSLRGRPSGSRGLERGSLGVDLWRSRDRREVRCGPH